MSSAPSAPVPPPAARTRDAALTLVAVVAAAVYVRALWNGWAIDDVVIASYPLLRSVRTLPQAMATYWWYPTAHLYRPLTTGTIGLELVIGHGAAWLPHATNVLLHALVAVLVTRLCLRWLSLGASLFAGLYFAVLPTHVEGVATLVARAEVLCAAPLVALLLLATRDEAPTPRTKVMAALLALVALGSKEVGIAAPLLVLGAAWAHRPSRQYAASWAGAAAVGTLVMLLVRILALGNFGGDVPHVVFRPLDTSARVAVALSLLPRSAAMLFLPVEPAINYTPSIAMVRAPDPWFLVFGAALLLAALALVILHVRRPNAWTLGALIGAATLAPTSNLLFGSGVVLSGRSMYTPSIGAALMVGSAVGWLAATRVRPVVPVVAAAYLAWCAAVTWREVPVWKSAPSAIAAARARAPESYWPLMAQAYMARDAGHSDAALADFDAAATLLPFDVEMLTDGAALALSRRDTTRAIPWLRAAIEANPRARRARTRLASVLLARGERDDARRLLADGLRLEPGDATWRAMLGRGRAPMDSGSRDR
jgi:tetratricopeptide (TPR) repeat protein